MPDRDSTTPPPEWPAIDVVIPALNESASLPLVLGDLPSSWLREVVVVPGRSYFDTNTSHHHHFFCEEDRYLVDIPGEELKVVKLPHPPPGTTVTEVDIVIRVRKNPGLEG